MRFEDFQLGPKMLTCSDMERRFVWHYVTQHPDLHVNNHPNATQAARDAGYKDAGDAGIRVRAHELMNRERVLDALEEVGRALMRQQTVLAIMANRRILENPSHPDHARIVMSTLSRGGISERTAVDVNHSGEVQLSHTDQAVHELRILKREGATQEFLENWFGHSGLSRYEKMLLEQDRRSGKLIEAKAEPSDG